MNEISIATVTKINPPPTAIHNIIRSPRSTEPLPSFDNIHRPRCSRLYLRAVNHATVLETLRAGIAGGCEAAHTRSVQGYKVSDNTNDRAGRRQTGPLNLLAVKALWPDREPEGGCGRPRTLVEADERLLFRTFPAPHQGRPNEPFRLGVAHPTRREAGFSAVSTRRRARGDRRSGDQRRRSTPLTGGGLIVVGRLAWKLATKQSL